VYLVTVKMPGYCLFSMTPSERAAIALLDDQQRVHVLERDGDGWAVRHDWPVTEHSHTDLMRRLADAPEPASIDELVRTATGQ
jgi:hypothetical protein